MFVVSVDRPHFTKRSNRSPAVAKTSPVENPVMYLIAPTVFVSFHALGSFAYFICVVSAVPCESWLEERFPDDYRALVLATDSGTLTGAEEALHLEPIDEVIARNSEERYRDALQGMVVVADNGLFL